MSEPQVFTIQIPLRADLIIQVQIPLDLTVKEAERIGRAVRGFASDNEPAIIPPGGW